MNGMATHASMVEQGQGEHDATYSISGICHWYRGYALRPPSRWVGRCARQTRRNVNTKAHKHPHYANNGALSLHNTLRGVTVTSIASSPTSRCRQRAGLMKKMSAGPRAPAVVQYWSHEPTGPKNRPQRGNSCRNKYAVPLLRRQTFPVMSPRDYLEPKVPSRC